MVGLKVIYLGLVFFECFYSEVSNDQLANPTLAYCLIIRRLLQIFPPENKATVYKPLGRELAF